MGKIWIDNLKKRLMYSTDGEEYEVIDDSNNNITNLQMSEVPQKGILPNTFYQFGFVTDTLRIILAPGKDRGILWEYRGEFTLEEGGNVIFPSNIVWAYPKNPEFKQNHRYQFKIVNLIGIILEG